MSNAQYWIDKLNLQPHPEGGFFRETWRSPESISQSALPPRFTGSRSFSTAIYFLLRSEDISHFHRLNSEELWHFYTGSPLTIHMINPSGAYSMQILGPNFDDNQVFQYMVSPGTWFGATVNEPNSLSLIGCTVSPGFDFADFELAKRESLLQQFPQHKDIIELLTKPVPEI